MNYYFYFLFIAHRARWCMVACRRIELNEVKRVRKLNVCTYMWKCEQRKCNWNHTNSSKRILRRSKSAHDTAYVAHIKHTNIYTNTHAHTVNSLSELLPKNSSSSTIYIFMWAIISGDEWFECMPQTNDDRCVSLIGSLSVSSTNRK